MELLLNAPSFVSDTDPMLYFNWFIRMAAIRFLPTVQSFDAAQQMNMKPTELTKIITATFEAEMSESWLTKFELTAI